MSSEINLKGFSPSATENSRTTIGGFKWTVLPCTTTGGVVPPGTGGGVAGADTVGNGLGELVGDEGALAAADGTEGGAVGAFATGVGGATGELVAGLAAGAGGMETGRGPAGIGGVLRAVGAGATGGIETGAGRLTAAGAGGALGVGRGGGGGAAGRAGIVGVEGVRAAIFAWACSSFSRGMSCTLRTIAPAGSLVVKFWIGSEGGAGGFGADVIGGGVGGAENGAVVTPSPGGSVAVATALSCPPNSCSIASAEILSIVLDTLLTSYLRSFSRANSCLLSMPIFFASSWMRMLIQS